MFRGIFSRALIAFFPHLFHRFSFLLLCFVVFGSGPVLLFLSNNFCFCLQHSAATNLPACHYSCLWTAAGTRPRTPTKTGADVLQLAAVGPLPACHPPTHEGSLMVASTHPPVSCTALTREGMSHSENYRGTWWVLLFSTKHLNVQLHEENLCFCRHKATKFNCFTPRGNVLLYSSVIMLQNEHARLSCWLLLTKVNINS